MPAIKAHSKVLVTGATGFIAAWVIRSLIDHGHSVVGTVRSAPKGDYLKNLFGEKFSYVIVPDIEQPGAFDEALKLDVDAVAHTASPVTLTSSDPAQVIGPAVKGTTGILESIEKYGTKVQRVVITSSAASVLEPKKDLPYTFTEADWNNTSPDLVEKEGKAAPGIHIYRASKVLAERAAWTFVEARKGSIQWDLVTILPPLVFGPTIHEIKDISSLNASLVVFRDKILNPSNAEGAAVSGNLIDVRDVGLAHVLTLEQEAAGGERFITSNGPFSWQNLVDDVVAAGVPGVPEGIPGSGKNEVFTTIVDGRKAEKILGLKYRSARETAVDTVLSLRERFPKDH